MQRTRVRGLLVIAAVLVVAAGAYRLRHRARHLFSVLFLKPQGPETPDLPEHRTPPKEAKRTLEEGRSYLSVSPQSVDANTRLPIVLLLHGDEGTAESMRAYTGFDRASREDAHVAYAQAKGVYWGVGTGGISGELAYLRNVVADVVALRNADASRIFVFGWSSGAYIAQAFACRTPEVRALALSGPRRPIPCDTGRPTLVLHSEDDHAHAVAEGDAIVLDLRQGRACSDVAQPMAISPCVRYTKCSSALAYCRPAGDSHFPWKHAAEVAWSFFSSEAPR